MSTKMMFDNILVKEDDLTRATSNGILYVKSALKDEICYGTILDVGPGYKKGEKTIPLSVQIGNKVAYKYGTGNRISVNGEELLVMRETEIYGVVDEVHSDK